MESLERMMKKFRRRRLQCFRRRILNGAAKTTTRLANAMKILASLEAVSDIFIVSSTIFIDIRPEFSFPGQVYLTE